MKILEAVKEYQCPGCVCGTYPEDGCYEGTTFCEKHCSGTTISNIGRIYLGLPKGFSRLGYSAHEKNPVKIKIFSNYEELNASWAYDKFNVPCWKHRNEKKHIFVRGLMPRINEPFLHIILEDCLEKIDCLEITDEDLLDMD